MGGALEALGASQILDSNDPSLLTWKEIQQSYGSVENFFNSFGLKPYEADDVREALTTSRAMKAELVYMDLTRDS